MAKFAGFIIGAIEIGVGLATGNVALVVTGVMTIAAQAVTDLTMPKGNKSRNALETELQLGEIARRAIFGKTATAGSLVDAFNYGGKYGTDHEVVIFALADHQCEELVGVYVNDVWVPWAGDGNYSQFDTHHLSMYFRDGSEAQTLPSVVTTNGPGWTSSDSGAGICYAVVDYLADKPDAKHPAWPGGRPNFLWVVKGKKCYDPRLDTTVGGSGSHRWDDPSTWEWSENPIVCAYNWRRGIYACDRVDQPEMLVVGRGLTAAEAPPSYIFSDANLCDEVMDDTLPRYTIGGTIAADEKYIDVEEKFAAACGGIIIQPEGTVQIEPAQARTPSFSITDDDILVGTTAEYNQGVLSQASSEWVNRTIPTYVSPDQKWQDHAAPVRQVQADILADGGPREEQIQLQLVTNERQASDIGEIHRKFGRYWARGQVVLGPDFAEVEEGDWGTWTSARYGFSKTFRAEGYALDQKWQNTLSLREISSAIYDGVFGEGDATGSSTDWDTTTPPIDIGEPDSGNWSLAAVLLTDTNGNKAPALEITGATTDDDSVEAIIFEYWKSDGVINPVTNPDDPTWVVEGTHPPSTTKVDIGGLVGGASYYAAVTYVVSGIPGDRLVLGPVTAGSVDVSGQVGGLITTATDALAWKQPVRTKTAAALAANTYANGSSGVGATLTGNSNGALAAVDGVTLAANDRVLVDQESSGSHDGIYKVTQLGSVGTPYILTRTTDANTSAKLVNACVKISEGSTFADQEWQCTTDASITVGTTALVWARFPDIQKLLDTISSTRGTVLYRGNSAWSALAPGTGFLKSNGAGADPSWSASSTFTGTLYARNTSTLNGATSTSAFASKGHAITPLVSISVSSIWWGFTPVNAATYKIGIYEVGTDLVIDAITGETASRTTLGTTNDFFRFDFSSPISLTAGLRYILVMTRTDSTTNYVLPLNASGNNGLIAGLPIKVDINTVRLTTVGPAVGNTYLDTGSAGSYEFALVGTFTP